MVADVRRGKPNTVRTTLLVAALIEGQVLAEEVAKSATRMQTLAATGERALLINEAGRIGTRAVTARREMQRLASQIDR
jgi:hypothetical protein